MKETTDIKNQVNQNNEHDMGYDNLVTQLKIYQESNSGSSKGFECEGNNYKASFGKNGLDESDDFIYIRRIPKTNKERNMELMRKTETNGLKFHVSVDPSQINDAWKIVLQVMSENNVKEAKFANPLNTKYQEPGKEITLYTFNEDRDILEDKPGCKSWNHIISEITLRLYKANIRPGCAGESNSQGGGYEQSIPGTDYVTWRNDGNGLEFIKLIKPPENIPKSGNREVLGEYLGVLSEKELHEQFPKQFPNETIEDYNKLVEDYESLYSGYAEQIYNINKLGENLKQTLQNEIEPQQRLSYDDHLSNRNKKYDEFRGTEGVYIIENNNNNGLIIETNNTGLSRYNNEDGMTYQNNEETGFIDENSSGRTNFQGQTSTSRMFVRFNENNNRVNRRGGVFNQNYENELTQKTNTENNDSTGNIENKKLLSLRKIRGRAINFGDPNFKNDENSPQTNNNNSENTQPLRGQQHMQPPPNNTNTGNNNQVGNNTNNQKNTTPQTQSQTGSNRKNNIS